MRGIRLVIDEYRTYVTKDAQLSRLSGYADFAVDDGRSPCSAGG
jgi:hypothetical protein